MLRFSSCEVREALISRVLIALFMKAVRAFEEIFDVNEIIIIAYIRMHIRQRKSALQSNNQVGYKPGNSDVKFACVGYECRFFSTLRIKKNSASYYFFFSSYYFFPMSKFSSEGRSCLDQDFYVLQNFNLAKHTLSTQLYPSREL